MKYNEPIRPAGIGRKQLAFPTGGRISELTEIESEFNDMSSDSTAGQIESRISNAIGVAKGSALAAASDAQKKTQNYPFGMVGITDFALSGTAAITTRGVKEIEILQVVELIDKVIQHILRYGS